MPTIFSHDASVNDGLGVPSAQFSAVHGGENRPSDMLLLVNKDAAFLCKSCAAWFGLGALRRKLRKEANQQ